MRRIIYISRGNIGDDPAALDAIVAVSSERNAAAGISGMLWTDQVNFVQALEGGPEAVGETMARISADPRHTDIEIVCDCTVQTRMFGKWGMVRADTGPVSIASTAYLLGYATQLPTAAAQRIADLLLAYDE